MIWIFSSFLLLATLCCLCLFRFERKVYFLISLPFYLFFFCLQIFRVGGPDYYSYEGLFVALSALQSWEQVWPVAFANGWYEPYQTIFSFVLGSFGNQYSSMLLLDGILILISTLFAQYRFKYFPFYLLLSFPFYFANIMAVRLSVSIAVVILLHSMLPERKSSARSVLSSAKYLLPSAIHLGSIFFVAPKFLIDQKLNLRFFCSRRHLKAIALFSIMLASLGFFYIHKYAGYFVGPPSLKLVAATISNTLFLFLLVRGSNKLIVYFPFFSLVVVSFLPLSQRAFDLLLVGAYFFLIADISRRPCASRVFSDCLILFIPAVVVYGLLRLISQFDYLSSEYATCFFCGFSGF